MGKIVNTKLPGSLTMPPALDSTRQFARALQRSAERATEKSARVGQCEPFLLKRE